MDQDLQRKLAILADAAKYDASCASSGSTRKSVAGGLGNTEGMGICHSYTPDGRCISLLKILLTNFCVFDCTYCINRVSSEVPRARFTVAEVVTLTLEFYRRNYIEGLFLSSGVARTPDETMEEMVEIGRRLREDHKFGGYLHLKAVAGASPSLLLEAGKWADRLSANVEFPTQKELNDLAPAKQHGQIKKGMDDIAERIQELKEDRASGKKAPLFAPGGQSTQMIVGATPSTDQTILTTSRELYRGQKLRRVYYTAFSPIPKSDARLPSQRAPLMREHRLYQADWLLRFYGFSVDEIAPDNVPNLDLEKDPKLSWAIRHPEFFPIDINTAPKELLLRVPGLGVRNVERIISIRRFRKLRLDDLRKLKVSLKRVKHFVVASDNLPVVPYADKVPLALTASPSEQLSLFDAAGVAASGEF